MSDTVETTIIYTHKPFGKDRVLPESKAKLQPAEKITTWEISHSEPLISHELAAAREVTNNGLVTEAGTVHREGATLVKGLTYLQLLGKTVTKTVGAGKPETFTPTPDAINKMPKSVVSEFADVLEYGKIPSVAEATEAGE